MDWKTLLACIIGSVEEQLLLRNEYLVEENRILRKQSEGYLQLTDAERQTLAEIGKKLGKQALGEIATIVKPDTILGWHRKLVANKFDGSKQRKYPGRPRVNKELEDWVNKMAKENQGWGYDRIAGALANLGYDISDQTGAISSNAEVFRQLQSARRPRRGENSSAVTCTCCGAPTFSARKSGRWAGGSHSTCFFSSNLTPERSTLPASQLIPLSHGWSKWLVT